MEARSRAHQLHTDVACGKWMTECDAAANHAGQYIAEAQWEL
jgi:succinate dehydrogenase/fumarate reductase-like Fe-S protein